MLVRGMNGTVVSLTSEDTFYLSSRARKDTAQVELTIVSDDDHSVVLADGITREEGEAMEDAFFIALSNGDEIVDLKPVVDPI